MVFKYLVLGFFVKLLAGFDDTITHVPILASLTRTRRGRIAFSIGTLFAVILAVIISIFFSALISGLSYYRYITAGLIFALAAAIYFDVFIHKPRTGAEKRLFKLKRISAARFTQLLGIGFVASFATVLDDIIVFLPLFLGSMSIRVYAITGVLAATILEIMLVIYFAEKISRLRYKEEIASIGLVILGILILTGVI